MSTNSILRLVLVLWVFGYLFVSCSGVISGNVAGAGLGLFAGILFFVPWLIGVIVLGALIWLTNPRRPI